MEHLHIILPIVAINLIKDTTFLHKEKIPYLSVGM